MPRRASGLAADRCPHARRMGVAKDFATSAELKEAMTKAGVVDTPTIYFLELIHSREVDLAYGISAFWPMGCRERRAKPEVDGQRSGGGVPCLSSD